MYFSMRALLLSTCIVFLKNVDSQTTDAKYPTSHQKTVFKMSNDYKHLFWFIQISDLHLSIFSDLSRIEEFKTFCQSTVDIIKPLLVIASGDLTDGKSANSIGTFQVKNEWVQYYKVLNETRVADRTLWMDIRGNHDGFNIGHLNSSENYFNKYSIQGKNHSRSYVKQLTIDNNKYTFLALDSCLDPGQRRPFHFIGYLDETEIAAVKNIISKTEASGNNFSIWFGHFPTSAILAQHHEGVRSLIGEDPHSLVYLSGHFHTFGGLVRRMYTLHSEGFLELELGDWKDNRLFRLLAFDHGLLSFTDVHHKDWPIILVTNPKHALFVVPNKENIDTVKQSSHIRILVFSISGVQSVQVKINDDDWQLCKHVEGPLYVSKWTSDKYFTGLHTIHVHATAMDGTEKTVNQPFSMDGTTTSFGVLSAIALKSNIHTLCKIFFGIMFLMSVLPLSILKCLNVLVRKGKLQKPVLKGHCFGKCIRKLWILTTVDKIFFPLWIYPFYVAIGPWTIGFIIEDYWGVLFTWGIIVNGVFLPGSVTYACSAIQLLIFHVPLTIILSNGIYQRFMMHSGKTRFKTVLKHGSLHVPLIILLGFQVFVSSFFLLTFGFVSFLLGILPTWSSVFAGILWYKVLVLPQTSISEAAKIWSIKIEPEPSQIYTSLPATVLANADSAL